eukprot:PhM_4_TR4806/c0_g1_i1/m.42122
MRRVGTSKGFVSFTFASSCSARCSPAASSSTVPAASALFALQARTFTHGFVRPPALDVLPKKVDGQKLSGELHDFYINLKTTGLCDDVHVMGDMPTIDSVRTAETLLQYTSGMIVMPRFGYEHRTVEFNDTMRYIRSHGAGFSPLTFLQDAEGATASALDMILVNDLFGLVIAQSRRTNKAAVTAMRKTFSLGQEEPEKQLHGNRTLVIELDDDAPPLRHFFHLCGPDVVIAWKDKNGQSAVTQYEQQNPGPKTIVYVEPGCNIYTIPSAVQQLHVIVESGQHKTFDALSAAGLNPVPSVWKEMKKLNIAMVACVLHCSFARSGSHGHTEPGTTPNNTRFGRWSDINLEPTAASGPGQRLPHYDDEVEALGGPKGRWTWSEPEDWPVFQESPRYRAPQRRGGPGIVPKKF